MDAENSKLLVLALKAFANGELTKKDLFMFSRDHKRYKSKELTFRELMESIREPKGDLKEALVRYYAGSVYSRKFK